MSAKRQKKLATRAEKHAASLLGARPTFNSGAGDEKGDSRVRQTFKVQNGEIVSGPAGYRIETKHTETGAYSLSALSWQKIETAALKSQETPIFHIKFTKALWPADIAVIPRHLAVFILGGNEEALGPEEYPRKSIRLSALDWHRLEGHAGGPVNRCLTFDGGSRLVIFDLDYLAENLP
jgi:hypothetical protein